MQRTKHMAALAWVALTLVGGITAAGVWGQQNASAPTSPALPVAPVLPGKAVVLDHVVAVINGSVILQSDVTEEIRLCRPAAIQHQYGTQHTEECAAAPDRSRPHSATNADGADGYASHAGPGTGAHYTTAGPDSGLRALPLRNRRRLANLSADTWPDGEGGRSTLEPAHAHSLVHPVALRRWRFVSPRRRLRTITTRPCFPSSGERLPTHRLWRRSPAASRKSCYSSGSALCCWNGCRASRVKAA
jgi:hypothetical protein